MNWQWKILQVTGRVKIKIEIFSIICREASKWNEWWYFKWDQIWNFIKIIVKRAQEKFSWIWYMLVKVAQSCLTLWDPMDYTVYVILQVRILEWVAFPFSRRIFPTQGSNLGLSHCRQILYCLRHQGSPKNVRIMFY